MSEKLFLCGWLLIFSFTLIVRSTTHYVIYDDRLVIWRIGFIWMEIPFRDVEEIKYQWAFLSQFSQIKMYRLSIPGRMLRIRKSCGFRYVLINPRNPDQIIQAWRSAKYPEEAGVQGAQSSSRVI